MYMTTHIPDGIHGLLLDYAATSHMFTSRNSFFLYEDVDGEYVSVGGLHRIPVKGQGSVRFKSKTSDGIANITLTDVLHVPNLGANLVSLGTLQQAGAKFNDIPNGLVLTSNNVKLFHALLIKSGTLYQIQCANKATHHAYIAEGETM